MNLPRIWVEPYTCYLDELSKYQKKVLKKMLTEKRMMWLETKDAKYAFTDNEADLFLSLKFAPAH